MLLEELINLHDRKEEEIGPLYHREDQISWIIQITKDGEFQQLIETSGDQGKHMTDYRANRVRTVNVAPYLIVDKPYYVLGLNLDRFDDEGKVEERHQAYLDLIGDCSKETGNPYIKAVEGFLTQHLEKTREDGEFNELDSEDMLTFRVEDKLVHQLEEVQNYWIERQEKRSSADNDLEADCMLCGEHKPIAKRHPVGSQLGQAGLITANENAFESYGLNNSEIAPLCQKCALKYGRTLRYLFSSDNYHLWIGGVTFAYWTAEPTNFDLMNLLQEPDTQEVENLLETPLTGREEQKELDNKFYALLATTNKSRLVIRDWLETTIGEVKQKLTQFFKNQRIVNNSGELGRPLSVYSLAGSLVRDFDDLSPNVIPALINNALKGVNLPDWILNQAIKRARADTDNRMTRPRAAIIKMVLNQKANQSEARRMEEKLDLQNDKPAYLCGRLLGVLEDIQEAAQPGINSTIVDRFYGTASSSPVSVFGNLLRKSQNHLSKLRNTNEGAHHALQEELEEVLSKLDGFPKTLSYEEQGQFSLGYYHQRAKSRSEAIKHAKEKQEQTS